MRILTNKYVDSLFTMDEVRELSKIHWTPVSIATRAARFLTTGVSNANILDIGSGVGKFCIVGGFYNNKSKFTGIEQREVLVEEGKVAANKLQLSNVKLITANFMDFDINGYTGIYFYNSFYENLFDNRDTSVDKNDSIKPNPELYDEYTDRLINCLMNVPTGTRLATYHSSRIVPDCYECLFNGEFLKFWIKK